MFYMEFLMIFNIPVHIHLVLVFDRACLAFVYLHRDQKTPFVTEGKHACLEESRRLFKSKMSKCS